MAVDSAISGTLIPIGGSEDKGENQKTLRRFLEKGVLRHVLDEAKGNASKVVVIPTASRIPEEVGENYIKGFGLLGCTNVEVLNIRDKRQSEDKGILAAAAEADIVFLTGGNQIRIPQKIGGSSLHRLMVERYRNDGLVIAGTSAGAMCMAEHMIAGGSSSESLVKGAVKLKGGMGLIPELIVDTHFVRRGRFGRLAEAVAAHPDRLGIGIAEDTGVIIRGGGSFTVIGSGLVMVMDPSALTHNTHALLKMGTPMSLSNLTVHILANGDRFTLGNKQVDVLPIGKAFV
ncbi:MAG: cyanophycinase [Flavobacteriales bacterium]|jgi:cyanophycinase